jgi:hypothetical protein
LITSLITKFMSDAQRKASIVLFFVAGKGL